MSESNPGSGFGGAQSAAADDDNMVVCSKCGAHVPPGMQCQSCARVLVVVRPEEKPAGAFNPWGWAQE